MRPPTLASAFLVTLLLSLPLSSQTQSNKPGSPENSIRAVMDKSLADWNRGDLDTFATSYKNSPDILFVGNRVSRGYSGMLEGYRKSFPTPAARGTLSYTNLEVHPLDGNFAAVIGNCHLERTPEGGGNFDCIFSLIFEKTAAGWKIILDHSSALPPTASKAGGQ